MNEMSKSNKILINMILKTNICLFKFLKPNDAKLSKVFLEFIILNIFFQQSII